MLKAQSFSFQIIYDIETIPCLETAKRVYPELQTLADEMRSGKPKTSGAKTKKAKVEYTDAEIDQAILTDLYRIAGSTESNPRPFLKYFLHQVVSISGISRKQNAIPTEENPTGVELKWFSLPNGNIIPEAEIIGKFLRGVGERKPQLIGWCNTMFDMHVLMQRGMICGLEFPKLQRPSKPWEGADYFSSGGGQSDYNIDLMNLIASRSGQSKATLNEFARALKIPGKVGVSGDDVAELWFAGRHRDIINYNECDTATTYLLWLEMLRFSGHILVTDYELEKQQFRTLLYGRINDGADHLREFALEWDRLQGVEPMPIQTPDQKEFLNNLDSKIEEGPEAVKDFVAENKSVLHAESN